MWVAVVVVFWSLVVALVSVVMYLVHLGRLDGLSSKHRLFCVIAYAGNSSGL